MKLREYLYKNSISIEEMAKTIDYNKHYLSRVMRGLLNPSARFIFRVDMATKGQVKEDEIADDKPEKKVKNLVA